MRRHGATPGHKLGLSVINDYEFLKLLKGQDDKYIAYSLGHGHNTRVRNRSSIWRGVWQRHCGPEPWTAV